AQHQNDRVGPAGARGARHDCRGAGVSHQLQLSGGAVREADGVHVEVHDPARVHAAAGELHGIPRQCWNSQVSGTLTPSARRYPALSRGLAWIGEFGVGDVNGTRPRRLAMIWRRSMWKPSLPSTTIASAVVAWSRAAVTATASTTAAQPTASDSASTAAAPNARRSVQKGMRQDKRAWGVPRRRRQGLLSSSSNSAIARGSLVW